MHHRIIVDTELRVRGVEGLRIGSSALLVQLGGTQDDQRPHGTDIVKGLISLVVPSSAAVDPGRSVGRAVPARARARYYHRRTYAGAERLPTM